jgi:hypothetical protein
MQRAAANRDRGMAGMTPKVWVKLGANFLVFAVLLFGPAGTLAWPAAWASLMLFFGGVLWITRALARDDPALLDERMKPLIQKGQPRWDKIIMASFVVLSAGWLILMGVDPEGSIGPPCRLGCNGSAPPVSLPPCGFGPGPSRQIPSSRMS